ncbi:hypothetical protein ACOME3_009176 [Neoechinorhynchus agilis]
MMDRKARSMGIRKSAADKHLKNRPVINDHIFMSLLAFCMFFPTGIMAVYKSFQANEYGRPSSLVYWPSLAEDFARQSVRWSLLSYMLALILYAVACRVIIPTTVLEMT